MSVHRSAVAYCVRADRRRSWPAWVALGLLVGIAGGAVTAAAAGARRTDTAYRRLAAETAAFDVAVAAACGERAPPTCADGLDGADDWPGVVDSARFETTHAPITDAEGEVIQINGDATASGSGEVDLLTPLDDRFGARMNRVRILEGRAADPSRPDEAVMAPIAAEAFGVEVGDELSVFLGPDVDEDDRETWTDPTPLTVVGIGMSAAEIQPRSGFYLQGLHTTPAFAPLLPEGSLEAVGLRLEPGTTIEDLRAAPGVPRLAVVFALDEIAGPVDDGLRADANALWLVAAMGGLASLFVIGPVLSRHARSQRPVDDVLASAGWSRQDRTARGAAHGLLVGIVATGVLTIVALVASTRTPIGDARGIDPSPGPGLDVTVWLIGVLVTVGLVMLLGAVFAGRSGARSAAHRRTPLAALAARWGVSPTGIVGIRVGLEPGRGQAPVRSALVAVAAGAAVIVGVLAYTSSAEHVTDDLTTIGVSFDDLVYVNGMDVGPDLVDRALTWPEVERAGFLGFFTAPLYLGEDTTLARVMAYSTGPDAIEPVTISGRAPQGPRELLVAPKLADQLGVHLGDEIEGGFGSGDPAAAEDPIETDVVPFEVVGIGPVPLGDGNFDVGAAMTVDGYLNLLPPEPGRTVNADFLILDRAPGATDGAVVHRLAAEGVPYDPDVFGIEQAVATIVAIDVTSTQSAPDLLGLLVAVIVAGVLAYALASTVSRNGRDLAVLRALGFAPRQVRRAGAIAALLFAAAALVIAVPLGIVAGRLTWRAYAESLGIVPTPFVHAAEVVALTALVIALAGLVAWAAAVHQNRTRPGAGLRAE